MNITVILESMDEGNFLVPDSVVVRDFGKLVSLESILRLEHMSNNLPFVPQT